MYSTIASRHRMLLLGAAVVITIWDVAGFFQGLRIGYSSGLYGTQYVVEGIRPGGQAEQAGLQVGDRVISVQGIPVEELGMQSRWPRALVPRVGETQRFTVERDGVTTSVEVVYNATPRGVVHLRLGGLAIVLSFLWFGMWALLTVPTSHARTFAYLGLAAGAAASGPHLGAWNGVATHVQTAALVLWSLLLLRFFLFFPEPKGVTRNRLATMVTYGAWVVLLACLVLELIFHPTLYHTFGPLYGLLILGYLILALAAVVHTFVRMPRRTLGESGMSLILIGLLVAIVPTLVGFIDWAFLWNVDLPGSSYYPLLLVAFPLTLALAVRKQATIVSGAS